MIGRMLRTALPMNQANLRCLGLSVGIAFALAGCVDNTDPYRAAFRECMNLSYNDSADIIRECREYASGMEARQGGNAVPPRSGDSPAAKQDAQGDPHATR